MFKVIIAGGRDFNNYEMLEEYCLKVLASKSTIEVVSGTAPGADSLGETLAIKKGFGLKSFPAPWDEIEGKPASAIGTTRGGKKYWKRAGMVRNKQMAEYADALIVFHDGTSTGTANMIRIAEHKGLPIKKLIYGRK